MTLEQIELARHRLRLGITNVGFWVLAAAAGLWWLERGNTAAFDFSRLGMAGAAVVAVQAGFDVVGGKWLMPAPRPAMRVFLQRWLPGVLGHTLVLTFVGVLSYASFRLTGGFWSAIVVATAGMAVGRRFLLRAIGGVTTRTLPHTEANSLVAESSSAAFTGGISGFGSRARSVLPAHWLSGLTKHDLAAESSRRQWQVERGLPARSLILVLCWNLVGASVGSLACGLARRPPAEALLGYACCMTIWAFGGLLLLPTLSRAAVFAADRFAADSGHDPRSWITRFPEIVGEDGSSRSAVQAIFYPIPSAAARLRQLGQPHAGAVLGNLARTNLYYSWATLTLLGRAVHCNVGQPALWVFPPSA